MKLRFLVSLLASIFLVTGCSTQSSSAAKVVTYKDAAESPLIPTNYAAADRLLEQLKYNVAPSSTLIIATLVNIDALENSSTLGRLISEQVSARFTQNSYRMVELKFRNNVYIAQDQGEFMLTREIHELAKTHSAQAVIVGTYAQSRDYVYINLKVIQPNTNTVLAVHDYALPLDENNRHMLHRTR
jgi:TolB-like protein